MKLIVGTTMAVTRVADDGQTFVLSADAARRQAAVTSSKK